jgi:hypothetical protein
MLSRDFPWLTGLIMVIISQAFVLSPRRAKAGQTEANEGLYMPGELARREDRLKALGEAKAKIAERVEQRDAQAQQTYQDKVVRLSLYLMRSLVCILTSHEWLIIYTMRVFDYAHP